MTKQSKQRRGGLGRGLGALIPTAPIAGADSAAVVSRETGAVGPAPDVDRGPDIPTSADGAAPVPPADEGPRPVPGASFAQLPVAEIHANRKQPRQVFDEGRRRGPRAGVRAGRGGAAPGGRDRGRPRHDPGHRPVHRR